MLRWYITQLEERSSDMDSTDGGFAEFVGSSSPLASAAAGGIDRWTEFEYTPVHLSYR